MNTKLQVNTVYLPNFNINNFYSMNFDIIVEPKIVLQKAILVITNSNH